MEKRFLPIPNGNTTERRENGLRGHSADNEVRECRKLAHPTRFERVTFAFGGQRSIQLSYGCVAVHLADWPGRGNGPQGSTRSRRPHLRQAILALNKTTRRWGGERFVLSCGCWPTRQTR